MKTSNLILLGVGGYALVRLLGLSKLSNNLTFTPASVGANRNGSNVTVTFGLNIDNPTPVQATVQRTYGTISDSKGSVLGRFQTSNYTVAPNGITRIDIPIKLQLGGTLFALFNTIVNKEAKLTINYTNEVGLLTTSDKYDVDIAKLIKNPLKKNTTKTKDVVVNPLTV